jgi:hypothetical protein
MIKTLVLTPENRCACKIGFKFCAMMDNRQCYRWSLSCEERKKFDEEQRKQRAA